MGKQKTRKSDERDEILKQRLQLASETIAGLVTQINFYTWLISILIAVFGLVIPLLGYFFVIRPQSELKQMITQNIGEHLAADRAQRINTAIEQISSEDYYKRNQGLTTLLLLQPIMFSGDQIARLILIINGKQDPPLNISLASLLSLQESKLTDKFFEQDLKTEPTSGYYNISYQYYLRPSRYERLKEIFSTVPNPSSLYLSLIGGNRQNKELITKLLNEEVLVNVIMEGKNQDELKQYNLDVRSNAGMRDEEYEATSFYRRLPHF